MKNLVFPFMGKPSARGNTAIRTCDGINRDLISIQQDGDYEDADLILLFGRDAVESLRDVLTLHLELMDKEIRAIPKKSVLDNNSGIAQAWARKDKAARKGENSED